LYHGVPDQGDGTEVDGQVLEQHIAFLQSHCVFISANDLNTIRHPWEKVRVLLTFDDGLRNNADVVAPILRRYHVPALFFVCSRHAVPGKYLWFVYLKALEKYFQGNGFLFRGHFVDMIPTRRQASMQWLTAFLLGLRPHPEAMYHAIDHELPPLEDFLSPSTIATRCAGMTADHINALAADPLFTIGAHTVDHPLLTRCEPTEAWCQLRDNKVWIEQVTQQPCHTMAYPSGDYNATILAYNHRLGFHQGYAVVPQCCQEREQEIPRIGVYSPSLDVLGVKVCWGNYCRALGLAIG
jgi:peptidoglycan/xylan/chitin deacetylase (PgdA/CDA1 family)